MSFHVKTIAIITLGLSACVATGYLIYALIKKDEDDYYDTVPSVKPAKLEIKIPKENVKTIIGRNGSNVKDVERKTQTKINFRDAQKDENYRLCIIRGQIQNCLEAENIIHQRIMNQPVIESKIVWVPQAAIGRIIGRHGERIQQISLMSGAKINISSDTDNLNMTERRIALKGNCEQIEMAVSCIFDIVREDTEYRKKLDSKLAQREPRGKPRKNADNELKHSYENLLQAAGNSNQIEVYVSAIIDPSQFWLHLVGPNATELDQLVEEMTEYYSKPENTELHVIPECSVGEIVAAIFMYDGKWYRAEIIDIQTENEQKYAHLFYVDYGDTDRVLLSELFELRTDFLRLRFQAIECYLAQVQPKDGEWSVESIDKFEEWTQVAQWKKLRARINGYKEREKMNSQRVKREGSPIPGVDLYDITQHEDIDIAAKLVSNDFATFINIEKPETSQKNSVSNSSTVGTVDSDSTSSTMLNSLQDEMKSASLKSNGSTETVK